MLSSLLKPILLLTIKTLTTMCRKKNLDIAARNAAIHDIKECLREEKKAFLLYRKELNPIMDELVKEYSSLEK